MIPDNATDNIPLFYEISELNRSTVLKSCQEVGKSEEEFIEMYSTTAKYAWQRFYYHLFKLRDLKEFQWLSIVFFIGLILIMMFVK
jgi:hypothetical protein